jgi:hypothetical protein
LNVGSRGNGRFAHLYILLGEINVHPFAILE